MDVFAVEAFAASWIEITHYRTGEFYLQSKPLRLRGLKYTAYYNAILRVLVEAFAASWIEIYYVLMVI